MRTTALILAVGMLLAACGDTTDQALGTLERDRIELAADSNEPIVAVLVQEGQSVVPEEPLLLYHAGRAAELSGDGKSAVSLYRQLVADGFWPLRRPGA